MAVAGKKDIGTVVGIFLGIALILGTIMSGPGLMMFVHVPSMMVVFGGMIAATLISYPLDEVKAVVKVVSHAFSSKEMTPEEAIREFPVLATRARKEGLLSLAAHVRKIEDEFFKDAMGLVVNQSTDPAGIIAILNNKVILEEQRHKNGAELLANMAKYAPGFGMVGTLIGLIQMLAKLDDPAAIGPAMAVALLTTFYGAVSANLIFNPLAVKLKRRSTLESLSKRALIDGIKSFQADNPPRIIELKMKTFVSAEMRRIIDGDKGKGRGAPAKKSAA